MSTKSTTHADIDTMSLNDMTQLRKDWEIRNLIYHYNTTRNKDTDPCVYVYEGGNLMHPSENKKYSVYFEKRGETSDDTPPLVRFNTITEVRTFIIALLSLRGFKPAQG